jgi:hypothetical protein
VLKKTGPPAATLEDVAALEKIKEGLAKQESPIAILGYFEAFEVCLGDPSPSRQLAESDRTQSFLFGMQNRTCGPCMADLLPAALRGVALASPHH